MAVVLELKNPDADIQSQLEIALTEMYEALTPDVDITGYGLWLTQENYELFIEHPSLCKKDLEEVSAGKCSMYKDLQVVGSEKGRETIELWTSAGVLSNHVITILTRYYEVLPQ